jgi:hypothetical protein
MSSSSSIDFCPFRNAITVHHCVLDTIDIESQGQGYGCCPERFCLPTRIVLVVRMESIKEEGELFICDEHDYSCVREWVLA